MTFANQTGSLINHLYSRAVKGQPDAEVGMGATVLCYTDRRAATIVAVETIRGRVHVTVQDDNAKRTDQNGMSEVQEYEYSANPEAAKTIFRQEQDGRWEEVYLNPETKRWKKGGGGNGLRIGERRHYHDYSF